MKEDILQHIGEIAANYTPEWDFEPENPDIGSALTFVYADMLEDTLLQLKRVGYKNQLAFFNNLGAECKGAVPARGYAVLGLAAGAPTGTEVPAKMGLTAEIPDDEVGSVKFETEDDVYVTSAQPSYLYLTDGKKDGIYQISENLQKEKEPLVLFREKGSNLQTHELYLTHEEVFHISGEAWIELHLWIRKEQPLENRLLFLLTKEQNAEFSYWTKQGWQRFREVSVLENRLLLHKGVDQLPFAKMEYGGKHTFVIHCQVKQISEMEQISVEEIRLQSRSLHLTPQYIYGANVECSRQECFPFGERMSLFEEVYFGSSEALTKRGAWISMDFQLDFVRIPLETNTEDTSIEWKWIMKRSDFRLDPEYDVTIEEVIWEYFNGTGWSRLFLGKEYDKLFSPSQGVHSLQRSIRFLCPEDMSPILVNSCETCYIRARILKLNNLYKLKGYYITPVMKNTSFSYQYKDKKKQPELLAIENNLERRIWSGREFAEQKQVSRPFVGLEQSEKVLYMAFANKPVGAPIRMLLQMEDTLLGARGSLIWEYFGEKGWKELNLADETKNLSRSGLVTFVGHSDFKKRDFFGKHLYWIRVRDEEAFYSDMFAAKKYPVLKNIYMNAVSIRHMEREETEYFTLEYYEESCSLILQHGNIAEIEVEILEGNQENVHWERWQETANLQAEKAGSKVYQVDKNRGVVQFGNGIYGQVPPFGRVDAIRIHYKCGGGSKANVDVGRVNRLNQTVGFVASVHNPERLWGGLDLETSAEALRRCGAALRHGGRAITARDYEELALEASRAIEKVRCFGSRNEQGEKETGAVTLVVLPKNYQSDKSLFYAISDCIYQYLQPRMDPGILKRRQFYVIEPKLAEIQVKAEISVRSFQDIFQVRKKVKESISHFLNPVNGHFDGKGWKIGQFPKAIQIQNVLKEIPEIVWIQKIYLMTFVSEAKGRQEIDSERIRNHPYVLPISGEHEVIITVNDTTGQR